MLGMMGIAGMASAQAPGQVEPVSAPFLEKRVPEELATEGLVLSRRNLALQVEQLGDRWLVSLADLTTGRVAASTKVDALPADREAAVAALTHVVSELAAQIVGRSEPPPPVAAPPPPPTSTDDRAERAQREIAELTFKRQSLRFGANLTLGATNNTVSVGRMWVVYQGDLNEELAPEEFYKKVGRPDLIEAYHHRRNLKVAGFVTAGVGTAVLVGLLVHGLTMDSCASQRDQPFDACVDSRVSASTLIPPLIAFGVAFTGTVIAIHYGSDPHPIAENDAKALADAYNQRLRRELGLPVVRREPLLRDLKLTPFIALGIAQGNAQGLALSARF